MPMNTPRDLQPLSNTPDSSADPAGAGTPSPARRRWRKPQIVYRETLEAVAADCSVPGGKQDPSCMIGFS